MTGQKALFRQKKQKLPDRDGAVILPGVTVGRADALFDVFYRIVKKLLQKASLCATMRVQPPSVTKIR